MQESQIVLRLLVPPDPEAPQEETWGLQYNPEGPDRDCGDFDTWQEAQDFYEAAGGPEQDPHRLDGDRDGVACAGLPGGP